MAEEIEVKLGAWPGFTVPAVDDGYDGLRTETGDVTVLDATYHDAADLRLVRSGITLRHRLGEGDAEGTWTLKFGGEHQAESGAMVREELAVAGPATAMPGELATLVRPWLRTAPLVAMARLQTRRRSTALLVDDEVVGSIDDDEVSVLQGGRVAARFREVEVEVAAAAPDGLLDAVVARLRDAGAGAPDPTPKVVRALGPRALAPPDLEPVAVDESSTAADVLRAGIVNAVTRIVEHDRVIRTGQDPEGIHQARVGTRRLRSDLRTFAPLLDEAWSEPLRDELKWLAGELGDARDRDVLAGRLEDRVKAFDDDDQVAAATVLARLDRERSRAQAKAVAALDTRRYLALLDRLVEAGHQPRTLVDAEAPAIDVLPELAGKAFHKLHKGVKGLGKRPADEELHRVRIKAKRARYAADVAVPVVGEPARSYTKALSALQDVLGDHHDCAVAIEWLQGTLGGATRVQAYAVGLLVADQRQEAERLRGCWRPAWHHLDHHKRTSWLGR
jgi:CHAD domain-containing protein